MSMQRGGAVPSAEDDGSALDAPAGAERYLWGLVVAVLAAAFVALIEIDAQSQRVVDPQGRAWPFSVLVGLDLTERIAGWPEVISSGLIGDPLYRTLLGWHLVADFVFLAAYGFLLIGLVRATFRTRGARRAIGGLVMLAVISDVVENLTIVALSAVRSASGQTLALLAVATTAKWVCVLAAVVAIAVRFVVPQQPPRRSDPRPTAMRTLRALMHHRFSVALVVPLFVLTVLSGSAILEQLPDVQRRWVSDGWWGWAQAGCAILALLAVAVFLEVLARFRSGWARRHRVEVDHIPPVTVGPEPDEPWLAPLLRRLAGDLRLISIMVGELFTDRPRLRRRLRYLAEKGDALLSIWVVGILLPLAVAAVAAVVMDAPVLPRLVVFCLVPTSVVIASWILRRAWQIRPSWAVPDHPPRFSAAEVKTIEFTGHALALVAVSIGGLGLIRSYVSVVMLGPAITGVGRAGAAFFLMVGVLAVALPWLVSWAIATDRTPALKDPLEGVGAQPPTRLLGRWLLLGAVLAIFVGLAVLPGVAARLGVSAAAILSLSALIGIPAAAALLIQERPTAEAFRILGLRRTPLVSVLVITVLLAGLTAGGSTIHEVVDHPATSPAPTRPAVSDLVSDWLAQPGCVVRVNGQAVRPMVMIAAEGGGIRAAYWTVKGLAAIQDGTGGCGARSTLFSGGASGGSVGLTVARFSGTPSDPGADRAVEAVRTMAQPATLAQAVVGTFVRDPAYGATGIPVGTNGIAPARTWADRARLIELGWDASAAGQPWGTRQFLADPATLSPVTGPLVLNSSSVASECRAWVSQLNLEQPAPSAGEQQCDRRLSPGARTVDLFAAYGPVGGSGEDCLGSVDASTAGLLTARFPYVTPGGVVGGCDVAGTGGASFWPRTQLIDGGYIENTGLATITDLSAQWLAQVRAHNDAVVAAGRRNDPLIMPLVVFLTNEQATAGRLTQPPKLQSELLLPAVGYLRGQATLTRTDALLQRAATTVRTRSICPLPSSGTIDCDAVAAAFPRRVIVVDRSAQPEVTAPLGWVLSTASMTALDSAMRHQVGTTCESSPSEPACLRGYGTLGDLLGYLENP